MPTLFQQKPRDREYDKEMCSIERACFEFGPMAAMVPSFDGPTVADKEETERRERKREREGGRGGGAHILLNFEDNIFTLEICLKYWEFDRTPVEFAKNVTLRMYPQNHPGFGC
jgi:hypothetical protein